MSPHLFRFIKIQVCARPSKGRVFIPNLGCHRDIEAYGIRILVAQIFGGISQGMTAATPTVPAGLGAGSAAFDQQSFWFWCIRDWGGEIWEILLAFICFFIFLPYHAVGAIHRKCAHWASYEKSKYSRGGSLTTATLPTQTCCFGRISSTK